jgi:hypothetical protein
VALSLKVSCSLMAQSYVPSVALSLKVSCSLMVQSYGAVLCTLGGPFLEGVLQSYGAVLWCSCVFLALQCGGYHSGQFMLLMPKDTRYPGVTVAKGCCSKLHCCRNCYYLDVFSVSHAIHGMSLLQGYKEKLLRRCRSGEGFLHVGKCAC